jgi:FERM/RhoGEF/pleckstrin domain protein 2
MVKTEKSKKNFFIFYMFLASSENLEHSIVGTLEDDDPNQIDRSCIQHRANTTMHVCWHRNLSVSINDHRQSIKNQLSGYLLRKFKNSNGWQKLWVVFTNFCLFFYKTYQVNLFDLFFYE